MVRSYGVQILRINTLITDRTEVYENIMLIVICMQMYHYYIQINDTTNFFTCIGVIPIAVHL